MESSTTSESTCSITLTSLCVCLPALDCCIHLCLAILYLSPSSGLHVACNPLHVSPCVYIVSQLWTAVAASALQSFVSQLWTSQGLVAERSGFEKHKLFGVYGGVIYSPDSNSYIWGSYFK